MTGLLDSNSADDPSLDDVASLATGSRLYADLLEQLMQLASSDGAALFSFDEVGQAYRCTETTGLFKDVPEIFAAASRLPRWCEANGIPLDIPDADGVVEYLEPETRLSLDRLSARMCLPLSTTSGLVGFVLLIHSTSLIPSRDVRAQLSQLCDAAARACAARIRHEQESRRRTSFHRANQLITAGQLAAAVAHEIRNPLAGVRLAMEQLAKVKTVEDLSRRSAYVVDAIAEMDRIEDTLRKLLGGPTPQGASFLPVDLQDLCAKAVALVRPHSDSGRHRYEFNVPSIATVLGNSIDLRRVVVNLLLNAVQATPSGGEVDISARLIEHAHAHGITERTWVLEIADRGPGIPAERLNHVFEPFFTTKEAGTGLGLAVSRDIVRFHHGELQLAPRVGGGTVASVRLPALLDHGEHTDR